MPTSPPGSDPVVTASLGRDALGLEQPPRARAPTTEIRTLRSNGRAGWEARVEKHLKI